MKMHIDIDTKTFIRFWLVVIGFGLVGLAIFRAWPALIIVGASFFLAIALNPSVNYIAKMLPSKSRVLSTALAYIAVIAVLGSIVFLVVPPIIEQTAKFVQNIPSLLDSATTQYSGIRDFINNYHLQPQVDDVMNSIKGSATQFASGVGTGLISTLGSIISVVMTLIIILVLTFLMLVEGPLWVNKFWSLYKNNNRMLHHKSTALKMYNVVTGYVSGQLIISAIDGLLAGVVVTILAMTMGVPANLAIPTVAILFVMSLIPFFGATIGAIFVGLFIAINSPMAALIFLIYFVIYQQVEGNFIVPKVQSKRLDLSPLMILVSIVIGIILFGIAGGIISIPVAGCINVLIENHFNRDSIKTVLTDKS
ncbi:MAG: AI-2E family transporter [Candidatus Saccharibacteria bacterium]